MNNTHRNVNSTSGIHFRGLSYKMNHFYGVIETVLMIAVASEQFPGKGHHKSSLLVRF